MIFDARICALGEGPLWHPGRGELFWFDITGRRMLSRRPDGATTERALPEMTSAAAVIDDATLMVATETGIARLGIESGAMTRLVALEADNAVTRSNDGRADPAGGFWVGTMGREAEPGAGAIYRFHRGELRRIMAGVSIPNATCFSPDGRRAYVADSARGQIWALALDAEGWPVSAPEVFADLSAESFAPDGAVTDAAGALHVACWGKGQVLSIDPAGHPVARTPLPAPHLTCPAFGGPALDTLYVTSATQGLSPDEIARAPASGATFALPGFGRGRPEPIIRIDEPAS
ncbi:SMP-30/gluconolactonase/LRE family protein [Frigidibacter sp. MR17.24]|uniref:SMP-30/gluconolactonase/LRE family protein n=1 Tax=Frigidibacter sp. MR17.24 TaxID=3127345 RepID=UPI0030131237